MAIPLLNYSPSSQNARVAGYEVDGDAQPRIYDVESVLSGSDMDELIWAAYRQVFSEHQILANNRQTFLESQLRSDQITVKDFMRGLVTSDIFLRLNLETNSNYRFVEICVQRLLGRDIYSKDEAIAWSIYIPTRGVSGFIEALQSSDEYEGNFGDSIVPYQRRRVLPQRDAGETPFNLKTPRYGARHRDQLGFPQLIWNNTVRRFKPQEKQPTAGNPQLYLDMARAVKPMSLVVPKVAVGALQIAAPYRKVSTDNNFASSSSAN
ncbi:MAG: phycobilisome rod-core linker polypeptide [Cyanobacteria bacterium P01_C01_bin.89]